MGWIIDGTSITENVNEKFLKKTLDENADVFGNHSVKRLLDYNMDIRNM